MAKSITEMTVEIITAQLAHRDMSSEEISEVLKSTFGTLRALKDMEARKELQGAEAESPARPVQVRPSARREAPRAEAAETGAAKPPVSEEERATSPAPSPSQMEPMDSIGEDKIVCLECGREFKQISHTHLKSHRLTPKEYRKKYHLPTKQPLTARSLSEKRKQKAIESGLGGRLKSLREAKQKG